MTTLLMSKPGSKLECASECVLSCACTSLLPGASQPGFVFLRLHVCFEVCLQAALCACSHFGVHSGQWAACKPDEAAGSRGWHWQVPHLPEGNVRRLLVKWVELQFVVAHLLTVYEAAITSCGRGCRFAWACMHCMRGMQTLLLCEARTWNT